MCSTVIPAGTYQVNQGHMAQIHDALLAHARDPHRSSLLPFPLKAELIDELLDAAIFTFLGEPTLLTVQPPVAIFGDVHGQFDDLIGWFDFVNWPPHRRFLFMGDYVDRGEYSLEVACFLLNLKIMFPKDFFLLRGNHEAPMINKAYGFENECHGRLSGNAKRFYRRFNQVFNCLPLAAIVNDQLFCMHGGLSPVLVSMDQIERLRRPVEILDFGLVCDLCWSDPDPHLREKYAESIRGAGHRFSRATAKEFCTKMNLALICRAHQVPESQKGFDFTFGTHKDGVLTIFSAPVYMDRMNEAACMMVDENMKCSFKVLKPQDHYKAH